MIRMVAIDAGKSDTKARMRRTDGTDKEITFATKMDPTSRDQASNGSYIVEYEGSTYLLGAQAETGSATSSKAEILHKIATYAAIHQLVDNNDDVFVIIGCPLAICENKTKKEEYLKFIFPSPDVTITLNGITKHFTVRKTLVAAESSGVIALDPTYRKGLIGIIDIGGLNINCCVYQDGYCIISTLFTENYGSNVFKENLKKFLFTKYGDDIPDYLMDTVIQKGYLPDNTSLDGKAPGSAELITAYKTAHIQSIVHKCQQHGWDLKHTPLAFVGGSSLLFRNEIKQAFPAATTFDDAAMINVKGFLAMLAGN